MQYSSAAKVPARHVQAAGRCFADRHRISRQVDDRRLAVDHCWLCGSELDLLHVAEGSPAAVD
jgi:hypothetical protein